MWNSEDGNGESPKLATVAAYRDAVEEFTRNANTLIEHLPLFSRARDAYEKALQASADLREVLDTGDETLRVLMTQVEQAITNHVSKPLPEKKKSEGLKLEVAAG